MVARVRSRRGWRDGRRAPRRRPPAAGRWCAPSRTARRGRHPGRRGRGGGPSSSSRPSSAVLQLRVSWSGTSTPAVADRGRQPPDGGGHHGGAARLRLDRDQPERLVVRRDGDQVGARYHWTSCSRATGGTNRTCAVDPQPRGEALQLARARPGRCRSGRRAPPRPGRRAAPAGARAGRRRRAAARPGALSGWIRPTKSSTRRVGRQAERGPGGGPVAGGEHARGRRPGGTTRDPAGVGVVQLDQLAGLVVGVGHEPVGGLDDLRLADLAPRRLGRVTVGQLGVLDPGHGVHGVHERHAPAVGGQPAHLAGEPVVGVHEVVPPLGPRGLGPHHPRGEGAQLAGQVLLAQPLVRPGGDVADHHAGRQLDGRAAGRRPWPG